MFQGPLLESVIVLRITAVVCQSFKSSHCVCVAGSLSFLRGGDSAGDVEEVCRLHVRSVVGRISSETDRASDNVCVGGEITKHMQVIMLITRIPGYGNWRERCSVCA